MYNMLSLAQIALLFDEGGFQETWEKAFFGVCLYAGCRSKEACTLLTEDVFGFLGRV
jgi:integrase/recombinase XerD